MRAKDCAARPIEGLCYEAQRYPGPRLQRPLQDISRDDCARRRHPHLPSNPDDVTEGYCRPSVEHLRRAVEQVTAFLGKRMARPAGRMSKPGRRSATG